LWSTGEASAALGSAPGVWAGGRCPASGFGDSVSGGVVVVSETTIKRGAWDWGDSPVAESLVKGSCSREGEGEDDVVALGISNG